MCVWVSASFLSCSNRALNATLMPECAEECGGQGERGAHVLGYRPASYGKLLRTPAAGMPSPHRARLCSFCPSWLLPSPFSGGQGPAEMGRPLSRQQASLLSPPSRPPSYHPQQASLLSPPSQASVPPRPSASGGGGEVRGRITFSLKSFPVLKFSPFCEC